MTRSPENAAPTTGWLRLAELIAALSVGTDLGTGQPPGHARRTCLLSLELARRSGVADDRLAEVYYLALLRFVGCTADAADTAALVGGDEIRFMAGMAPAFMGSAPEQMRALAHSTGSDVNPLHRAGRIARVLADINGPTRAVTAHCDAAQQLAKRLGVDAGVTSALGGAFERWDGKGIPGRCAGQDVPAAVRVVIVARDVDLWVRQAGLETTIDLVSQRSGHAYDPAVAQAFTTDAAAVLDLVNTADSWRTVLAAEPDPVIRVGPDTLSTVLEAFADFTDLKSPWFRGHSRAVASLAADAALAGGLADAEVTAIRQAGLLHDIGRVGVPNGIWDRAGPLSVEEWEKVRLHPYLTERILKQSAALAPLARLAASHHERGDGSGYHRGARIEELSIAEQLLAAADHYQTMTESRPHRPALASDDAATALRREGDAGLFSSLVVSAVLDAAGHPSHVRPDARPAGLTEREVEVLRLIARGHTNRSVAAILFISPKTVGTHVEHIYAKVGVSTRAGAALVAMEHRLLQPGGQTTAPGDIVG